MVVGAVNVIGRVRTELRAANLHLGERLEELNHLKGAIVAGDGVRVEVGTTTAALLCCCVVLLGNRAATVFSRWRAAFGRGLVDAALVAPRHVQLAVLERERVAGEAERQLWLSDGGSRGGRQRHLQRNSANVAPQEVPSAPAHRRKDSLEDPVGQQIEGAAARPPLYARRVVVTDRREAAGRARDSHREQLRKVRPKFCERVEEFARLVGEAARGEVDDGVAEATKRRVGPHELHQMDVAGEERRAANLVAREERPQAAAVILEVPPLLRWLLRREELNAGADERRRALSLLVFVALLLVVAQCSHSRLIADVVLENILKPAPLLLPEHVAPAVEHEGVAVRADVEEDNTEAILVVIGEAVGRRGGRRLVRAGGHSVERVNTVALAEPICGANLQKVHKSAAGVRLMGVLFAAVVDAHVVVIPCADDARGKLAAVDAARGALTGDLQRVRIGARGCGADGGGDVGVRAAAALEGGEGVARRDDSRRGEVPDTRHRLLKEFVVRIGSVFVPRDRHVHRRVGNLRRFVHRPAAARVAVEINNVSEPHKRICWARNAAAHRGDGLASARALRFGVVVIAVVRVGTGPR